LQIAGIFNYTKMNKGLQVGLINYSDSSTGVSIGLLSIVKNGIPQLEISTDEFFLQMFHFAWVLINSIISIVNAWLGTKLSIRFF